jgi:hypothetical protein
MMLQANERCGFLAAFHFETENHDVDLMFQMMGIPSHITWTMNDAAKRIPTDRIRIAYFVSGIQSLSSFRCIAGKS